MVQPQIIIHGYHQDLPMCSSQLALLLKSLASITRKLNKTALRLVKEAEIAVQNHHKKRPPGLSGKKMASLT